MKKIKNIKGIQIGVIIFLFVIINCSFFKAQADCKSAKSQEFCDWRDRCRWTSRGCIVGRRPDEKETSILNNFGLSEIEFPARDAKTEGEDEEDK